MYTGCVSLIKVEKFYVSIRHLQLSSNGLQMNYQFFPSIDQKTAAWIDLDRKKRFHVEERNFAPFNPKIQ